MKDDPELAGDAREVSARATDLSSLMLARGKPAGRLECAVTYHDSCHLAHGMGVREGPRKLLGFDAGRRLIEMAEADLCCGSAGSYNLTRARDGAIELARRKADNIVATGADYVMLGNPGCEFQIAAELRRRGAHDPRDPSGGFSRAGRKLRRVIALRARNGTLNRQAGILVV